MVPDEVTGLHVAIGRLDEKLEHALAGIERLEQSTGKLPCAAHSERMAVLETRMKTEGARAGGLVGGIVAGIIAGVGFLYKALRG